jgi:argininosuccinate lyase
MATLWNKGVEASAAVDAFTVCGDRVLDLKLASYDVIGSKAHIRMLESIGLLSAAELELLTEGLDAILTDIDNGDFVLEDDVEDIHSQVELLLTRRLGDIGKKIHSGRSRNDQVLLDIKLFLRDEILTVKEEALTLFATLQKLSDEYRDVLLPGYTHEQIAMPSSFGLWFGAYAESLVDDMYLLGAAYKVVNRNPLGSAAGYGSSFPLDREMTTQLLGFDSPVYNSVAAQLGRGSSERAMASALGAFALTLNKFAADCCLFMCPNFGFISFPAELTTGSSIMPHKKNPDVWEIMRGHCNRIMACENEISMLCSNLTQGYHRDFQLLKDVLFPVIELMHDCLRMCDYMISQVKVNRNILDSPLYDTMFTVEEVNRRVLEGEPFRDAYKAVGIEVNEGRFVANKEVEHTHIGSIGNLCNDRIASLMADASDF